MKSQKVIGSQYIIAVLGLMIFQFTVSSGLAQDLPGDNTFQLPRKVQRTLDEEVFPAFQAEDDEYFYNVFAAILPKLSAEMVDEVSRYAKSK